MATDEEWAAAQKLGDAILDAAYLVGRSKFPFTRDQRKSLRGAIMAANEELERCIDPHREPELRTVRGAKKA